MSREKKEVEQLHPYTDELIGENILKFINSVDTAEAEIGDYRSNNTLIVTGVEYENSSLNYPITIMVPIEKAIICTEKKLVDSYGKNVISCVDSYLRSTNTADTAILKYKELVKKFLSNKCAVMCIRPDATVTITQSSDGIKSRSSAKIIRVRTAIDLKQNRVVTSVLAKMDSKFETGKTMWLTAEDYGTTWVLPKIEQMYDTKQIDYNYIKMNNFGFVKPIVVKHKNIEVALDGFGMYATADGVTEVIGMWTDTEFEIKEHKEIFNPLIDKIKDKMQFISSHKRYIAPYLVATPNIIEI